MKVRMRCIVIALAAVLAVTPVLPAYATKSGVDDATKKVDSMEEEKKNL